MGDLHFSAVCIGCPRICTTDHDDCGVEHSDGSQVGLPGSNVHEAGQEGFLGSQPGICKSLNFLF